MRARIYTTPNAYLKAHYRHLMRLAVTTIGGDWNVCSETFHRMYRFHGLYLSNPISRAWWADQEFGRAVVAAPDGDEREG